MSEITPKEQAQFDQLAKDAGLPQTEADIKKRFNALRNEAGQSISNQDAFGPFWRFVEAAAIKPVLWLLQFVTREVMRQAFVKTASGPFLKLHAWAVNLEPKPASRAAGRVFISRQQAQQALSLPAGTIIESQAINQQIFYYRTTAALVLAAGSVSGTVEIESTETGAGHNLAGGYIDQLADPIAGVVVRNSDDWLSQAGAEAEADDDLRERIRNQFIANNPWHTDAAYKAIIAKTSGLSTDNIYFTHGVPRGPASANAYLMLEQGQANAELIAKVQADITEAGNHGHGDDLQIFAMPETRHVLTVDWWAVPNTSAAEAEALAKALADFIRCAFRENGNYKTTQPRPWSLFSFSTLGEELHQHFNGLDNISFNLEVITTELNLPRIQTLELNRRG